MMCIHEDLWINPAHITAVEWVGYAHMKIVFVGGSEIEVKGEAATNGWLPLTEDFGK